jgi:hypothetical protein
MKNFNQITLNDLRLLKELTMIKLEEVFDQKCFLLANRAAFHQRHSRKIGSAQYDPDLDERGLSKVLRTANEILNDEILNDEKVFKFGT